MNLLVIYRILAIFLFFCVIFTHANKQTLNTRSESKSILNPTVGQVWPKPMQQSISNAFYTINPESFRFNVSKQTCWILEAALVRYYKIIFSGSKYTLSKSPSSKRFPPNGLSSIEISLNAKCEEFPYYGMNEAYNIQIDTNVAVIDSMSLWGILRGLETFSQLVYINQDGQFLVNKTVISDFPRFSHRGILLDTSRHFLNKLIILSIIEAMAYNKMNVFHWHIVDDQSFPYQSFLFPKLSQMGAYHPYTHVYTLADVAEVIQFARMRGIRVIPEFDTPGHTQSWGPAIPGLLTPCYKAGKPDGTYGPFDPTKDSTYNFLHHFFSEVLQVFPDNFTHLGGDEVSFNCWKSNPDITAFMTKMNITGDYEKLENYYETRLLDIIHAIGPKKSYVVWQEIFDNNIKIKPDTIVHVWKEPHEPEMAAVTSHGYHTILSACWYLDDISTGSDWHNFYQCEPFNFNGTETDKSFVNGGEACLWGEYVDSTNVVSRLWPRASAVAERLWSNINVTDLNSAEQRLEEHRCRMIRRGIGAEPDNGPGHCDLEYYDVEKRITFYD